MFNFNIFQNIRLLCFTEGLQMFECENSLSVNKVGLPDFLMDWPVWTYRYRPTQDISALGEEGKYHLHSVGVGSSLMSNA